MPPTFLSQMDLARALVNHANIALLNASALVPGTRERIALDAIQKAMLRMELHLETFIKAVKEIQEICAMPPQLSPRPKRKIS